jgi:hypothetical protein
MGKLQAAIGFGYRDAAISRPLASVLDVEEKLLVGERN